TTWRRQNHLPENPMPAIDRPSERASNRQQKSALSMSQADCGAFLPDLALRRYSTNPLPTILLRQ
ncbi:MAG: hypothetical protein OXF88_09890, partial [Rhodobacteraceae bacterium]|nr:hypothetical protein [Paracoccaceae bacterium]